MCTEWCITQKFIPLNTMNKNTMHKICFSGYHWTILSIETFSGVSIKMSIPVLNFSTDSAKELTLHDLLSLIVIYSHNNGNKHPSEMWNKHHNIHFTVTGVCLGPAGIATLWQRCCNVVVDVVTMLWHGRKWELYQRLFPTLWQRRSPTLSRRCHNVAATLPQH